MSGEEKFNSCKNKSDQKIEIFEGCPCRNKKKLVDQCLKQSIIDLNPQHCEGCVFYENKNP